MCGCSCISSFLPGGHGIGKLFHTKPDILHYKNNEPNGIMKEGHTFTIEPMICEGTGELSVRQKVTRGCPLFVCPTRGAGETQRLQHGYPPTAVNATSDLQQHVPSRKGSLGP